MSLHEGVYWALVLVAIVGALSVVVSRDVMRMTFGLAAFLLSVAGFFALFGLTFLAVAQVFVYVGGVLVLMVFAIMAVHRSEGARPILTSRHDVGALAVAAGVFVLFVSTLRPMTPDSGAKIAQTGIDALATNLLGPMLPHFEFLGVVLLVALVAIVCIAGGERR